MSFLRKFFTRLRALFRKDTLDREMSEELRHHLDQLAGENIARGMTAADAEPAAQRSFGHLEGLKEQIREQRGFSWLENLLQDSRYGLRMLRKSPGFTAVTILTLALGVGATTAIFSIVNGVVLRPLPYRDTDRLVLLRSVSPQSSLPSVSVSRLSFHEWEAQTTMFESLGTCTYFPCILTGAGEPARLFGYRVSASYFPTLGVQPILGRNFRPEEAAAGKDNVVILSHRLWLGRFNGRSDVIGQSILIDDRPCTIIGILPGNIFPEAITDPTLFLPDPVQFGPDTKSGRFAQVIGRLKPGVTLAQASGELSVIAARVARQYPDTNKGWGASATSLLDAKIGNARPFLLLLLGAVGFLLLIACVNVANLLLARASSRAKEIALRAALGASRGRIIRQLLCESLIISLLGSLLGVLIAYGTVSLLLHHAPLALPRTSEIAVDGPALLFSCALAFLTGLGFGLVPALQASRVNLPEVMNDASRGSSAGGRGLRLRSALVVVEVSLALVLLVAAGLLMHSFIRLQSVPVGYSPGISYISKMVLPKSRYPTPRSQIAFVHEAVTQLSAVPGVHSVVFSTLFPAYGGNQRLVGFIGRPDLDPHSLPPVDYYATTPDYFRSLSVPLGQGRLFSDRDNADSPSVAIVSHGFAEKYFPRENALGQRITVLGAPDTTREIIGVVGDVREYGPLDDRAFQVYVPFAQEPTFKPDLLVRVDREFAGIQPSLRRAMDLIDPDMPFTFVGIDLKGFQNELIAPQRYALFLFSIFSGVALLLSALGIYGVVSYSVTRRTQEIGIRLALGAQAKDILSLIFSQTGRMVGLGVVIGLAGSLATTQLLSSLLFQVGTLDPLTFVSVPIVLGAVAFFACWLPARRATQVDPLVALRSE